MNSALAPLKALLTEYSALAAAGTELETNNDTVEKYLTQFTAMTAICDKDGVTVSATHKYLLQTCVVISKLSTTLAKLLAASNSTTSVLSDTQGNDSIESSEPQSGAESGRTGGVILTQSAVWFSLLALGSIYSHVQCIDLETVRMELALADSLSGLSALLQQTASGDLSAELSEMSVVDKAGVVDTSAESVAASSEGEINQVVDRVCADLIRSVLQTGQTPELIVRWKALAGVALSSILVSEKIRIGVMPRGLSAGDLSVVFAEFGSIVRRYANERHVACRGVLPRED